MTIFSWNKNAEAVGHYEEKHFLLKVNAVNIYLAVAKLLENK